MSEQVNIPAEYIYVTIPVEYLRVYIRLLTALCEYGKDMLRDCKASCSDRNSGIIECFNMFNAAVAAKNLGRDKLAELLINYVDSTLNLKYKNITIPDTISFPVRENDNQHDRVLVDFSQPPKFVYIPVDEIQIEQLTIIGDSSIRGVEYVFDYEYTPSNATQTSVIWSIDEGSEYASINGHTGKLYIKPIANNSRIVIRVTSGLNASIYETKVITCTYYNPDDQGGGGQGDDPGGDSPGGDDSGDDDELADRVAALEQALARKQDTLQSGVNIKTINNQSLLGTGNININGGITPDVDPIQPNNYKISVLTQQQYDALEEIDPDTIYLIYKYSIDIPEQIDVEYFSGIYYIPEAQDGWRFKTTPQACTQEGTYNFEIELISNNSIWSDGTRENKQLVVVIGEAAVVTNWSFGSKFPIIFGSGSVEPIEPEEPTITDWQFGGVFPLIL